MDKRRIAARPHRREQSPADDGPARMLTVPIDAITLRWNDGGETKTITGAQLAEIVARFKHDPLLCGLNPMDDLLMHGKAVARLMGTIGACNDCALEKEEMFTLATILDRLLSRCDLPPVLDGATVTVAPPVHEVRR